VVEVRRAGNQKSGVAKGCCHSNPAQTHFSGKTGGPTRVSLSPLRWEAENADFDNSASPKPASSSLSLPLLIPSTSHPRHHQSDKMAPAAGAKKQKKKVC